MSRYPPSLFCPRLWRETFAGIFKSPVSSFHTISPAIQPFLSNRIAERVKAQPESVHYDAGKIRVEQRWNEAPPKTRTVEETIERIGTAEAWVFLKQAQKAPEYLEDPRRCASPKRNRITARSSGRA